MKKGIWNLNVAVTLTTLWLPTLWIGAALGADADPTSASDGSCPLQNTHYQSIYDAAAAVQARLHVPAECAQIDAQLQNAQSTFGATIKAFLEKKTSSNSGTSSSNDADKANQVVTQLGELARIYSQGASMRGSCGKAVLSQPQLLSAVLDTAQHLTPILARFGGHIGASATLGIDILKYSVQSFMTLYFSQQFKMEELSYRQAFIDNACAYYRLQNTVEGVSIAPGDTHQMRDLESKINKLKAELKALNDHSVSPPAPSPDVIRISDDLERNMTALQEVNQARIKFGDLGPVVCGFFRSEASKLTENDPLSFLKRTIDDLEELLTEDEKFLIPTSVKRNLIEQVRETASTFAKQEPTDPAKCVEQGASLMQMATGLISYTSDELQRPGRLDLSCTAEYPSFAKWKSDVDAKTKELNDALTLQAYIQGLGQQGKENELVNIDAYKKQIASRLFGTPSQVWWKKFLRFAPQSPAQGWLVFQTKAAKKNFAQYQQALQLSESKLSLTRDKIDSESFDRTCEQFKGLVSDWFNAWNGVSAARKFCTRFGQIILNGEFPGPYQYCKDGGLVETLYKQVNDSKRKVTEFTRWEVKQGCTWATLVNPALLEGALAADSQARALEAGSSSSQYDGPKLGRCAE